MNRLCVFLMLAGLFMLSGCESGNEYLTYMENEPIFMSAAEFRSSVSIYHPQPIAKQGKIAFYNNYLYVSQPEEGIHVIDNRDPLNPKNVAFIKLLGNTDMHIRNNMLYADSYIDLVWFDISDPLKPQLRGRKEEVFPSAFPATGNTFRINLQAYNSKNGIVVGWRTVERRQRIPRGDLLYEDASSSVGGIGAVGSMSRFAIYQDNLYTVVDDYLRVFNLSQDTPVKTAEDIILGFNVETMFSYKNCLFMGTPTGMVIYSVENPSEPQYRSMIRHVFACDPVVVEDDIAYITIRSGTSCGQNANELIVVDVSNVAKPKHIVTYNMNNPKGLGIEKGTLFVCDDGLKIFNVNDPSTIMHEDNVLAHFKEIDASDVIPYNDILMMIAEDGIYQYDYADLKNIKQLSYLPIGK